MVKLAFRSVALSSVLLSLACGDDLPPADLDGSTGSNATGTGSGSDGGSTGLDGTAGSDEDSTGDGGEPLDPDELEWPLLECDPIADAYCTFPFPSNVFTVPDETMPTGRRVQLPVTAFQSNPDPEPWSWSDGFSPNSALTVFMPGATETGLPSHTDFDASLAADSPTVILDAETGELVAHWSELDYSASDPARRSLLIRPAQRLAPNRRYIVALRNVVDAGGTALPASPAFAALRDGTELPEEPSVEERRALYGDIFWRLGQAGVGRDDLQIAWDFTTASDENTTGWLLHMRDETFAALGPDGSPPYTIDVVDTEWHSEDFLYRIEGTFEVPLYLDVDNPATSRLVHGEDGLPVSRGTLEVPFWLIVPRSAETTPAAIMQHGHGLLGSGSQIESGHFRAVASTYNYAMIAVDWMGMATQDYLAVAATVSGTSTTGLAVMTDRLHQGGLNNLMAMRLAWAGLAEDPLLTGLLDPDQRYWYGISQGGILGGVYMGTTTEVERGVLDVLGQPYNILLTRSVDFDPFFDLLRIAYPDPVDITFWLGGMQMLWDRVEPTGYSHRIVDDPLPNTPSHEVLMTAALGDHQVSTLGAHNYARSAGVPYLDTGVRDIWGLPSVDDGHTGSALVEYDFGLPEDPICNLPQTACTDPHGKLRQLDSARQQIDTFLRTGDVVNYCPGGECSYPEQGECAPGEMTPDVCE